MQIPGKGAQYLTGVGTQENFVPSQRIIDTWYGILGYTENFIQQLLQIKISN